MMHSENHWGFVDVLFVFVLSTILVILSFSYEPLIQKLKQWMTKKEEEEKKNNNKWAYDLPDDILEQIMEHLCLKDYLALGKVCSSWRKTVKNAIANKHCCSLSGIPLALIISREKNSIFSLRTERECEYWPKRSLFDHTKTSLHGSVRGWMILSSRYYGEFVSLSFSFYNPVTNREVSVPTPLYFPSNPPSPFEDNLSLIGKMVASSTPDSESDCTLAGLCQDFRHIVFCRLIDNSWSMIESEPRVEFLDAEIMSSKLYVMTNGLFSDCFIVYDLKDFTNGSPKPKVLVELRRLQSSIFRDSGLGFSFLAKHETLEQLFLIDVYCNPPLNLRPITAISVFKLDMKNEPISWIECESLDDKVVFVSSCKSMVMSKASLNSARDKSIQENSVYFAIGFDGRTNPWQRAQLGVYHLTDNTIKYFSVERSNRSTIPRYHWFVSSI